MSDTSETAKDTKCAPAKAVDIKSGTTTCTTSHRVLSFPTSRRVGQLKLRISSREMPDRTTTTSTE